MKCTVLLAILLLAVSCSSTPALKESTFVCGELQIAFDETRRAVLDLPGERLVLEPLQKSGVILLYAELLPGVDDERVVTTRMMRFDPFIGRTNEPIVFEVVDDLKEGFSSSCL